MEQEIVINAHHVTMEFRRAQHPAGSLKELLLHRRERPQPFRALEDVSFAWAGARWWAWWGPMARGKARC